MKLEGFIGAAYQLDSLNVDAQRCVNLYPEVIESGRGKAAQVAYLRGTPGLEKILEVGDGPIRCIHVDSIGRVFVVSGAKAYSVSVESQWRLQFAVDLPAANVINDTDWDETTDQVTLTNHGYSTGLRVIVGLGGEWLEERFIIRVDANTIKFATTLANAYAGTAIDLSEILVDPTITPQSYPSLYNLEYSAINFASNTFAKDDHGYIDGLPVTFNATAQYPIGLLPGTTYYITDSSDNTFKLAASLSDALAGTAISFSAPTGSVFVKELGSGGEYGGSPIVLATSTGPVKAASMSAGGNGTDSSTIFVDGENNYLLEDLEGDQTFGVLGAVSYAQAVVDITNDITITTLVDVDDHILSSGITVRDEATSDQLKVGLHGADTICLGLYKDVVDATGATSYSLDVSRGAEAFAQAVIDITNDITIKRYNDDDSQVEFHVGREITIRNFSFPGGFGGFVNIDFYKDTLSVGDTHYYRIDVYTEASNNLTTAQLVEALTTGATGAMIVSFDSYSSPPTSYSRAQMSRTDYTFTGGGSQTTASAFGTPVSATFTEEQDTATILTTEELVMALSTGELSGKTLRFESEGLSGPPVGTTRTQLLTTSYTFTGGGSQQSSDAFGTPVHADFTRETDAGQGFGSVPSATHIVWSDGYFVVNQGGTNKFFISGLQDFEVNTLDFASSEGSPDIVLALEVLNRYLYVFNEKTTEVYANTGNTDFPFERIQGGFIEVGCAAAYSVAKVGKSICFLGRSERGEGIVYALEGLTERRISTHAIEQAIRGYADPSTAVGYGYETAGHAFYALNFDEATWVYDLFTGMWHERAYTNEGTLERHRAQACAFFPSEHIHLAGDSENNKLYVMSEDTYSDDGDAITRLRSTPHISSGRNWVFCSSLLLDMETGIGLDGGVQGSSPTVMLDWSNDGGHTWSSEQWALADAGSGQIGDYSKRVIWNRLGKFRQRVFRIKITDPVKVRLIDAQIELEAGAS